MLTELCQELRNWFEKYKYIGTFTIENGTITADVEYVLTRTGSASVDFALQEGQYYRIVGSVLNDGVYEYDPDDTESLKDEVFDGAVWAMAVPPAVIALSQKITEWLALYGSADSAAMSPFQSESFGGYSYSKSGGGSSSGNSGGSTVPTWKSVFADDLNRWRKI